MHNVAIDKQRYQYLFVILLFCMIYINEFNMSKLIRFWYLLGMGSVKAPTSLLIRAFTAGTNNKETWIKAWAKLYRPAR